MTGRIRVVDWRRERRLIVAGEIMSVLPRDGDWQRVRREYWWQALAAVPLPRRLRALFVGLGGGTQLHLLHRAARPRLVTVIERDPAIVHAALRWFDLDALGPIEFLCADAATALAALARRRRRFDFVMEDAAYAADSAEAGPIAEAAAALVAPRGALVINRHRRSDAGALAARLRARFDSVRLRRGRRDGDNVLVCCVGPRAGRA